MDVTITLRWEDHTDEADVVLSEAVDARRAGKRLAAALEAAALEWGGHDDAALLGERRDIARWTTEAGNARWSVPSWNRSGLRLVAEVSGVPASDAEPVGLAEVAERLGVARQTVDSWRVRGLLPEPRWTVGGRPAWDWAVDIAPWARGTGRLT